MVVSVVPLLIGLSLVKEGIYGIHFVKEAEERVQIIQQHAEAAQSRQRVTQIKGEVQLCSKLEIMCI